MERDRVTARCVVPSFSLLLATLLFSGCAEELPQIPAQTNPAETDSPETGNGGGTSSSSDNTDSVSLAKATFSTIDLLSSGNGEALAARQSSQDSGSLTNDLVTIASSADSSSQLSIAAVRETVRDCSGGGTVTYTRDDQGPPWFSEGDSYTSTFDQCVTGSPPNEVTTNGSRTFRVDTLDGQVWVTTPWTLKTTLSRTNFTVTTASTSRVVDGDSSVELGTEDGVVFRQVTSGDRATTRTTDGTERTSARDYTITYTWDRSVNTFTLEFDVATQSSQFNDVHAQTLTPLTGTIAQPPSSGQAQIEQTDPDGNTSIVTIEAMSGGLALVSEDSDGDGVVDSTREIPWSQIGIEAYLSQPF